MNSPPGARFAIIVLTAMNLLNYIDRYVPSAVKDLFKKDLHFSDVQTSLPLTAFVIVYMLTSPLFGTLADRMSRKVLIALGVALWSLATAGAALATGFVSFMVARALVGVGEAAYATIAPSLISDYFPPERRNRILTYFYVAIPVGAALGFTLGGVVGNAYGWRAAFLVCGLPGLLAAGLALAIREPGRGTLDPVAPDAVPGWPEALRRLRTTAPYVIAVAGYVAVTWAGGGMADWFPTFLSRFRGMSVAEAGSLTGTATVLGGLAGTLTGGLVADRLKGRTRSPYLALSASSMVPAAGFAVVALTAHGRLAIGVAIVLANFFLWCYNGPINAIIVNSVPAAMRARAVSISILSIHLLGDAISPTMIGAISDRTGNLMNGVALIPVMMLVGAGIWGFGWRRGAG
ncbi:MAG TPA: MFS transporter [Gemmatimonadales bacterium]|jgi:MFS family permease|nr:MFS transporter [Gemmatimonadales bacterium]